MNRHNNLMNRFLIWTGLVGALAGFSSCTDDGDKISIEGPVSISVTKDGADVNALEFGTYASSAVLTLETNAPWEVKVSEGSEWLTPSNRSGDPTVPSDSTAKNEPRYIKLSVEPLGDNATRTCTVTFKAMDQVKTISVTQKKPEASDESGWESAQSANMNMGVGVNLFNTLDAVGDWFDPDDVSAWETCWGMPQAKQEWFDAVAASGFKAVRIPVSWGGHLDENNMVKEPWMNRVEEVVNYALKAGLYCILNTHHEGGWLIADKANIEPIRAKFATLWTQIATRFNKYDHHLIFEGYNELLDQNGSWTEPAEGGYDAVNILAQTFVDAVRATGGNNLHRNLIVNTYSGGGSSTRLANLVIPQDKIPGHIMVEVHNYTPAAFSNLDSSISDDTPEEELPLWTKEFEKMLKSELDLLIEYSNKQGIPVVIGECGAYERIKEEERAKYSEFISTYARGNANISIFYWGHLIDRNSCKELYPKFIDGFLKGQ